MNEWGIALVGFVGAVVGAIVGFVGLVWQRNVQRDHDIRQRCAEMIVAGESIHDTYLQSSKGLAVSDIKALLESLNNKSTEMTLVQRYLELVAEYRIEGPAHNYWLASFEYVTLAEGRFKYHKVPEDSVLAEANLAWIEARNDLINALNRHKRSNRWQQLSARASRWSSRRIGNMKAQTSHGA